MNNTDGPKPGWTTSEFWMTLTTVLAPYWTRIFHQQLPPDWQGKVQTWASVGGAIATVAYMSWRTILKAVHRRTSVTAQVATESLALEHGASVENVLPVEKPKAAHRATKRPIVKKVADAITP